MQDLARLRVSLWGRRWCGRARACSSHITPYVKTSQGENWGLRGPPQAHLIPLRQGMGKEGDLQVSKCMSNKCHNLENMLGIKSRYM